MKSTEMFTRDWFSKPGDSIRHLMYQKGVSAQDLAGQLDGDIAVVRGILDGTIAINCERAHILSNILGGTETFWLRRQGHYENALAEAVRHVAANEAQIWLEKVLLPGPKPRGRPTETVRNNELRKRMVFYGVSSMEAWSLRYGRLRDETKFRTSPTYSSLDAALALWLRQGELEADLVATQRWDPHKLRASIVDIRNLTRIARPDRFIPKLRGICAKAGVALVVVRAPRGCRVSGASRLVSPDKAMILVSFRYRTDDHFWFTLFHEMGHLLLHNGRTFVDDEQTDADDDYEWQANEFARSCIIPTLRESEFEGLSADRDSVLRFSISIGIAPGLTVGQMQHGKMIGYERLNSLKRNWKWKDIEPVLN